MEGNSAKKAPVLDRLVDTTPRTTVAQKPAATLTQKQPAQPPKPAIPVTNNQPPKPNIAASNGTSPAKNGTTVVESLETPKNRRTDKSQFEIELTQIVNRIMSQYIGQASEQIVQQVLREVRARLPGQRK